MEQNLSKKIFKAYDIRGIYPTEINEELVRRVALAFWNIVKRGLAPEAGVKIAVARDARLSSPSLYREVKEALVVLGAEVYEMGEVSVNDLYFAVGYYRYAGGIMVTASHNPSQYGGLKMVLGARAGAKNLEFVGGQDIYEEILRGTPVVPQSASGMTKPLMLGQEYLAHILGAADMAAMKPFKVVVDAGNGMAGAMAKKLIEKLGGKVFGLFMEPDGNFPNRSSNPLEEGAAEAIRREVLKRKANFGLIFDGDGDRMFLVDEKGQLVRGDMCLLVIARVVLRKHPEAGIVYSLGCSRAVPEWIGEWGGRAIRSEVGYRNLSRHIAADDGWMSGEITGHFNFKNNYCVNSSWMALVLIWEALSRDGRPLSEMVAELQKYYRGDEINLEAGDVADKLRRLKEKYVDNIRDEMDGLTVEFADWWFNARSSNTEPILRLTIEANNQAEWEKHKQELLEILGR